MIPVSIMLKTDLTSLTQLLSTNREHGLTTVFWK